MSPAMAGGVSDHLWSWEEVAEMIDVAHAKPTKRGSYKKREKENSN
jgi:hypothetical protein